MTKYALIGAAGYIAPRHLKAIKETGGSLVMAYDLADSVGVMDAHFPDAAFYTEFELFLDALHDRSDIDYVIICSPNYLHKPHINAAMRAGCDVICEKPLVLETGDIDAIKRTEVETGQRVYSILQLRLHPAIIALKKKIETDPSDKIYEVDLGYFTSRGAWYHSSWKGLTDKSGGIATNIGVHFYDMLSFIFGDLQRNIVHHKSAHSAAGYLEYDRAHVRWLLSIDRASLPPQTPDGLLTYRSITVDGMEIEFSQGFTDLHTESYRSILAGNGYGVEVVRSSIEVVSHIRTAPLEPEGGEQHPLLASILAS